jgi:nicotinamide phosphoribosyltransferase
MQDGNLILRTDSYKMTHWLQYPQGTQHIYSYLQSRGSDNDSLMFFGLQYYLMEYFQGVVVTQAHVDEAAEFCVGLFGNDQYFNREGWEIIVNDHGGRLPLRIRAVDEGTWVPVGEAMMTIENTDPRLPWLTNWAETMLMKLWYSITVATYSGSIHSLLTEYANQTGGTVSLFHLNDFGYRGVSSEESAGIGGMAHLVSFMGTDTLKAIQYAMDYYHAEGGVGMSVLASEHSTTTSHLEENECAAFEQFIDAAAPGGIVSIVIDSYDAYRAVDQYIGVELKDKIINSGKRIVVRPDSGDPLEQVSYILNSLENSFGVERNDMGFKVLPPYIGVIYGDFMSYEMIDQISEWMQANEWAVDGRNVVFGMGGNLLQNNNRDTHKFAIKCSASIGPEGEWFDVYKDPKTMSSKASKRGRFSLVNSEDGVLTTVPYDESYGDSDYLKVVFEDGEMTNIQSFENIRAWSVASRSRPMANA